MSQSEQQLSFSEVAQAPEIPPLTEQEISSEVLAEKYAKGTEINVHDVRRRVARALAAQEEETENNSKTVINVNFVNFFSMLISFVSYIVYQFPYIASQTS